MTRIKFRDLIPICLLITVIILLFAKVLYPPPGRIIYGGDLLSQFYYWKGFLAQNLKQGIIPFWNPYNFSGTPFLAHPSIAFFYPLNIIFILLPLNLAFTWYIFLHFVIASTGMYLLGKFYSDKFSGIISASIFVLAGFFSSRVYAGHIDILSTAVWIPWVFWCVVKYLKNPCSKNWILIISFFCLEILAGYQAFVVFTVELISVFFIYHFIKNIYSDNLNFINRVKKIYMPVLFAVLLSLGITGVQWFPTYQFVRNSIRKDGLPYSVASWGSLPLSGLKLFINPFDRAELNKLSYGFTEGPLGNFFDYYIGKFAIILILITCFMLFARKLSKKVNHIFNDLFRNEFADYWFYILISIIFLVISFGSFMNPNIHALLYRFIPFYRFFRIPDQHLVMVVFAAALICAISVGNLKSRILKILVTVFIISELFIYSRSFFILEDMPVNNIELMKKLEQNSSQGRLLPSYRVFDPLVNIFAFNSGMTSKVFSVSGYDPVILSDYYHFINLANKNEDLNFSLSQYNVEIPPVNINSNTVKMLGIKYILSGSSDTQKANKSKFQLTEEKSVRPRFFIVPKAVIYHDSSGTENDILLEQTDLSKEVLLTNSNVKKSPEITGTGCADQGNYSIGVKSYNINRIELAVNNPCDGYLVTGESYYPGWQAVIDGKASEVLKSNFAFRSVILPKGKHQVIMYYSPKIYYLGGLISIISLLVCVSILLIRSGFKSVPVNIRK